MKVVAIFNGVGGAREADLALHLSWMWRELGLRVLVVDLDLRADLSAAMLPSDGEDRPHAGEQRGLADVLGELVRGAPLDLRAPLVEVDRRGLSLLRGDPALGALEERLAMAWHAVREAVPEAHAIRAVTAIDRLVNACAAGCEADVAVLYLGSGLGALNHAGLIASDHVLVPLAEDQRSLRVLESLGPALRAWREGWRELRGRSVASAAGPLPGGAMAPAGYVVLSQGSGMNLPSWSIWSGEVARAYRLEVLGVQPNAAQLAEGDEALLARVRDYVGLTVLAADAHKPIFKLTAADGAIGSHGAAVTRAWREFRQLALNLAARCGLEIPAQP